MIDTLSGDGHARFITSIWKSTLIQGGRSRLLELF
jgi:hypothetical protein